MEQGREFVFDWMEDARCAAIGMDLDDFFFEGRYTPNSAEYHAHVARLRRVCDGCPVRSECRNWADANDERSGFWAGETASQRHDRRFPNHRPRRQPEPAPSLVPLRRKPALL